MSYTVVWTPQAEQQITSAWLAMNDRQSLTAAINDCDASLRSQPNRVGESRAGKLRIAFFGSLTVWFRISDADRQVFVAGVRFR